MDNPGSDFPWTSVLVSDEDPLYTRKQYRQLTESNDSRRLAAPRYSRVRFTYSEFYFLFVEYDIHF